MSIRINYDKGVSITDPESHDRDSVCWTPRANRKECGCAGAKWFSEEEARAQPSHIKSRLLLRGNELRNI